MESDHTHHCQFIVKRATRSGAATYCEAPARPDSSYCQITTIFVVGRRIPLMSSTVSGGNLSHQLVMEIEERRPGLVDLLLDTGAGTAP